MTHWIPKNWSICTHNLTLHIPLTKGGGVMDITLHTHMQIERENKDFPDHEAPKLTAKNWRQLTWQQHDLHKLIKLTPSRKLNLQIWTYCVIRRSKLTAQQEQRLRTFCCVWAAFYYLFVPPCQPIVDPLIFSKWSSFFPVEEVISDLEGTRT